ncbi:TetR/AcrR family transcriptional regulator [Nonomuraea mesophila]|uniref:TetR/AcrR family transcriptional regulator n=1 Tax=Nonomuraea mesophila TaxID=2530382 RepID=A0A4R5FYX8_9ACTN|nr:TetR/AcrR family transcriptional regulator [Nonomuraea mesophila]
MPAPLRRLWRLSTGSHRGRPAGLDVDRVVRTAMELADRHGLPGATLPKVAETLGVTKMSLYRYVGSKDELFDLMADLATGPPPQISEQAGWRAGVRQWMLANRQVYERHPWLSQLPITGPPRGPHAIGWMDAMLRALRGTGLDWRVKVGVLNLVGGFVRTVGAQEQQLAQGRRQTGLDLAQTERAYSGAMAALVDADRFPEAAQLFASDAFTSPPPDGASAGFPFGMELILDGIELLIAKAGTG